MINGRVAAYTTSLNVISCLAICTSVFSFSGIWGITTLSGLSTTTTDSLLIDVSVAIYIVIYIAVVISITIAITIEIYVYNAISIAIDIDIVISIAIDIGIVIPIPITIVVKITFVIAIDVDIILYIAIVFTIGVVSDMGFHLLFHGRDKIFYCIDLSAESRDGWFEMLNYFAIILNIVW